MMTRIKKNRAKPLLTMAKPPNSTILHTTILFQKRHNKSRAIFRQRKQIIKLPTMKVKTPKIKAKTWETDKWNTEQNSTDWKNGYTSTLNRITYNNPAKYVVTQLTHTKNINPIKEREVNEQNRDIHRNNHSKEGLLAQTNKIQTNNPSENPDNKKKKAGISSMTTTKASANDFPGKTPDITNGAQSTKKKGESNRIQS